MSGELLFYRDTTQDGTGDVANPSVIGLGGWLDFKFLFHGGNGIIYAVVAEPLYGLVKSTPVPSTGADC